MTAHRAILAASLVLLSAACSEGGGPADPDPPTPSANQPPVADFTASSTGGAAPLTVSFDGSASSDPDGEVVSWNWEFGDGTGASGRVVTHTYDRPGFFFPRLTVSDARGATDTAVDSALVVTVAPGTGEGHIAGRVLRDRSGGGVPTAQDPGVGGMVVYLDLEGTGRRDAGDPYTVTDRDGAYTFPGVDAGRSYRVSQELSLGWTSTWARQVDGSAPPSPPEWVIGGTPAVEGEFPFMVTLLVAGVTPTTQAFTCGGTFLQSRWILTAAHCVADRSPAQLEVLVGTLSLLGGGERVPVRGVRVFPAFGANSFVGNDVAVLELDRDFLRPRTTLHTADRPHLSAPGVPATAVGWGRTSFGGAVSSQLLKVGLPLISNGECQRLLADDVVPSTVCAGQLGTTRSICSGDSGGPLLVASGDDWIQVGVTSFGANCQPPIAFARVSEFASWIAQQVPPEPSLGVEVEWGGTTEARVDFGNFR